MIPREILRNIRRIEIRTTRLVNELFSGEYHSTFKGQGMEFEEVREYFPGDDVRLIDWNVTARTSVPHIKKFREERELSVMFLLDASSSSQFGTRTRFKSETAAELCAVLAFSAIKNNDKVGMIIFTDEVEHYVPPKKGRGHVLRLVRDVLFFKPKGKGTNLAGAIEHFNRVVKKKSVVFLISDFLSDGYIKPLQVANRKHDVIGLRITDPRESSLENFGLIELEDAETGEVVLVDTGSPFFRKQYAARAEHDSKQIRRNLQMAKVDFVPIRTDQSYIIPLVNFFKMREKRA